MMNNDNIFYICDTCKKEFPTPKSLYGHQRVHSREKQLERALKKTRTLGQGTSNSVALGGYSLSNYDKYLCLSRGPIESMSLKNTTTFPSLNSGVTNANIPVFRHPVPPDRNTSYGFSSGTPLVTHNHNRPTLSNFNRPGGVSFGPFKSGGHGSSRAYPYSLFNGGITRAPPATPYRSRVPLPSYRYNNSHDRSLGSANSIGRLSNNNNGSSQGSLSLELSLGPSKSMGDSNNNSSSQDSLSLALSLGPSNSNGSSNNNSSAYPSLITGGETRNMNMPVRPRASQFHFHSLNPLDSITRNVHLSHPPPTTNMNRLVRPRASRFHFHSHNPLDSIIRNVPLSHHLPTTNRHDDNNVSGSSLIAKEKDNVVVLDDDDGNVVIEYHDEDQHAGRG